jgi:hypothetical protein
MFGACVQNPADVKWRPLMSAAVSDGKEPITASQDEQIAEFGADPGGLAVD